VAADDDGKMLLFSHAAVESEWMERKTERVRMGC
jgi:hypothetical protein